MHRRRIGGSRPAALRRTIALTATVAISLLIAAASAADVSVRSERRESRTRVRTETRNVDRVINRSYVRPPRPTRSQARSSEGSVAATSECDATGGTVEITEFVLDAEGPVCLDVAASSSGAGAVVVTLEDAAGDVLEEVSACSDGGSSSSFHSTANTLDAGSYFVVVETLGGGSADVSIERCEDAPPPEVIPLPPEFPRCGLLGLEPWLVLGPWFAARRRYARARAG